MQFRANGGKNVKLRPVVLRNHWKFVYTALLIVVALGLFASVGNALTGTVQSVTFAGPVTGNNVAFSLYLPPGYNTGTNRYPVIVHLHGINGTHNGQHTNLVPASLEAAVAAGVIEPCIVVFPDGYGDSFWADSVNSTKPAETNVRLEILPYVDANFRTIGTRERRVIQGFSMGGFGAAKFAAKFPELFVACVIYDGAMLNWAQVQQRHPTQAAEIFNNSAATFNLYSPWSWLTNNVVTLRANMPFRDSVGSLLNENRAWRDALIAQSITSEYVETGQPHSLGPLLDVQGSNSWRFIAQAFSNANTGLRLSIRAQGNDVVLNWPAKTGEVYRIEHSTNLTDVGWQAVATNLSANVNGTNTFVLTNALTLASGKFFRVGVTNSVAQNFTFSWSGTNFTYTDPSRSFTGVMLKPVGDGPFPAVVIQHGAGGSPTGYSLPKAREMTGWGMVCIAPTLTHVAGGDTNAANIGFSPENLARAEACLNVLASLSYVDTNRVAIFGHSMGAFATIGDAAALAGRMRAVAITAGGVVSDGAGTTNATPTVSEASGVRAPVIMFHCDADGVVPPSRSLLFQQVLNSNGVMNERIIYSSNSIPNTNFWHNIHQDAVINADLMTNTFRWFNERGLLP